MAKMTDRELIRLALLDAMSWQHSLAAARKTDTVAGQTALVRASRYRAMYKKKYGDPTPPELKARIVGVAAIRRAAEADHDL